VDLGTGRTDHGRMAVFCILRRVGQPMLHVHPGLRASEKDRSLHGPAICRCPALTKTPDDYLGPVGGPRARN
jgi:hypothetical protein